MNHKTAIRYRRHLENGNPAAAEELVQPYALPLYYTAKIRYPDRRDRETTFRAPADASTKTLFRLAIAALTLPARPHPEPTQGDREIVTPYGEGTLTVAPHNTARPRTDHLSPDHPLAPYHAAARFRLAHQADKECGHRNPTRAAALATARAALRPGSLTYLAKLDPDGPRAVIHAPADASRRQLMQLAKTALRCTGHPFRPLEYIDPPRITATAQGFTLTIRPEPDAKPTPKPLRPEDISDDEV